MIVLGPGSTFGHYQIERLLGRGGMGAVYLAVQVDLGRKVALKVMAPELAADQRFRDRFIVESRLAAALDHPNIVPIYEAGEADGELFLAMRYVEGSDLETIIRTHGRLEPERAVGLLRGVADALDGAHDQGLIHRDVKPGNILVAAGGRGGEHPYLTDFGLTKRQGSGHTMTRTGQIVGSVDYVAPEQIEGRPIDGRTDIYSLACVLYTCLIGVPPYPGEREIATLWAHVQSDVPRPSTSDPALAGFDRVIAAGMAKDPRDRPETAGALLAEARLALDGAPARGVATGAAAGVDVAAARPATGAPVGPRTWRSWSSRARRTTVAGAAAVTLVAVVGGVILGSAAHGPADGPSSNPGGSSTTVAAAPSSAPLGRIVFVRTPTMFIDNPAESSVCEDALGFEGSNLWVARDDGSTEIQLTRDVMGMNVAPALTPDARTIAFIRARLPGSPVIATMPASGGPPTAITAPVPANAGSGPALRPASWSADGQRVAYLTTVAVGSDVVTGVFTARADGSDPTLVWKSSVRSAGIPLVQLADTRPSPGGGASTVESVIGVDWLPDGRLVLLTDTTEVDASGGVGTGSFRFVATDPDGTDPEPLGPVRSWAGSFRVSPDGQQVAIAGSEGTGRPDIFVMNLDGSGRRQLTSDPGTDQDPVWSPDGKRIAYSSEQAGFPQIFVIDAAGGTPQQITHTQGRVANCQPSWAASTDPLPTPAPVAAGDAEDPLTLQLGDLAPGTYTSTPFQPAFQLTLPAGWEGVNLSSDALYLFRLKTTRVRVEISQVQVVFDETRPGPEQALPGHCITAPTRIIGPTGVDFVNWLKTDTDLSVGTVYPVSAGGANGVAFTVTVRHVPGDRCPILGHKTALYPFAHDQFALQIDDVADYLVLDVHGTRVIATVFGPAADREATSGEVQAILDSIRFP